MRSLIPKAVSSTKIRPEIKVIAIAPPKETAPAAINPPNSALEPIPVESAKGRLA